MKGKNSKLKAHFADKFLRDLSISKLKTIENARLNDVQRRFSSEDSDDGDDLLQKKMELSKFI